jgi:hypothetical protein
MNFTKDEWTWIDNYVETFISKFESSNDQSFNWGFADRDDVKQNILIHINKHKDKMDNTKSKYSTFIPHGLLKTICYRITLNSVRNFNKQIRKTNTPFTRKPEFYDFVAKLNQSHFIKSDNTSLSPASEFWNSLDDSEKEYTMDNPFKTRTQRREYDMFKWRMTFLIRGE